MVLTRLGTPTHSFDNEQRLIELTYTAGTGALTVTAPPHGNIAPPGYYMLFVLNPQGVPSVARMMRVGITTTDPGTSDFIAAAGGNGGAAFTLACDPNEVLAGVSGSTAITRRNTACEMRFSTRAPSAVPTTTVANILKRRIELFTSLPIAKLDRLKLQQQLRDIGKQ